MVLPVWAFIVGGAVLRLAAGPVADRRHVRLGRVAWRLGIVVAYVCVQLLVVAALAFLLSVTVDNPLGAVGGAVLLVVVSNILDQITALDPYRQYLPTHFQYSWLDTLGPPSCGTTCAGHRAGARLRRGVLRLAWLRFDRKDITS